MEGKNFRQIFGSSHETDKLSDRNNSAFQKWQDSQSSSFNVCKSNVKQNFKFLGQTFGVSHKTDKLYTRKKLLVSVEHP